MTEQIESIAPHGGTLIDRVLRGDEREKAIDRARDLPSVTLTPVAVSDLELIAVGAFSPLTGFLGSADYHSVVEDMRLSNGLVWSIPITLPVSKEVADRLREGKEVALVEANGHLMGILELREKYTYDKVREAQMVYRTTDDKHPGVKRLYEQGEVLLAGDIWLINRPSNVDFPELRHDPAQSRRMFASRGWRSIVGFQTRNPVHRAHEYIQKTALEIVDGLFLHPLVGETKPDDIPAEVRIRSYQSLLRDYYPPDRVILGVYPAAMRYAGPREAIFHALARKNYGCTHFIVGRDHAGVGNYYGTYDAQRIFDEFKPEELGIIPMFFENTFYCRKCGGVVSSKTCPHQPGDHIVFSGTQVREMLMRGEAPPPEFTRPEVARILVEGFRGSGSTSAVKKTAELHRQGSTATASQRAKVLILGMDCMTPQLVFEQWRDELPTFKSLMESGVWGRLNSTIPPITVPAWMCMATSKNPGRLGFYGFRNRADYSYERMTIANSKAVTEDTVWDILSRDARRVILIGVPQTYPPKPVNGLVVSDFLTPSTKNPYTYPPELKAEVEEISGGYMLDVENFRTEDKDHLLQQIYLMTEKRIRVVKRLLTTREWDFAMWVEMGPDRIHHGFWKYFDPSHPKHQPGNPYANAIKEYYQYLDHEIGQILALVPEETVIIVVSDHGAKRMVGGICINEWLRQEGYLTLREEPNGITPIEKVEIDWGRTKAWGAGGYYGRLFLNVAGREPQGTISPTDYERVREELITKLEAITDPQGRNIGTRVFTPEKAYGKGYKGIPPDLIIYFGDLDWRSVGSVGHGSAYTFENDLGPDDANHAQEGIFIMRNPRSKARGEIKGLDILDVAPTVLAIYELPIPPDWEGKVIPGSG